MTASTVSATRTGSSVTRRVPYAPAAARFDVVHAAEGAGRRTSVGPIVSSNLFCDPTENLAALWTNLGVLAVETEAAIFAIAAMRDVRDGCLLTVSDTIGAEVVRLGDDELRSAVDNMMSLALDTLNALN